MMETQVMILIASYRLQLPDICDWLDANFVGTHYRYLDEHVVFTLPTSELAMEFQLRFG